MATTRQRFWCIKRRENVHISHTTSLIKTNLGSNYVGVYAFCSDSSFSSCLGFPIDAVDVDVMLPPNGLWTARFRPKLVHL